MSIHIVEWMCMSNLNFCCIRLRAFELHAPPYIQGRESVLRSFHATPLVKRWKLGRRTFSPNKLGGAICPSGDVRPSSYSWHAKSHRPVAHTLYFMLCTNMELFPITNTTNVVPMWESNPVFSVHKAESIPLPKEAYDGFVTLSTYTWYHGMSLYNTLLVFNTNHNRNSNREHNHSPSKSTLSIPNPNPNPN